MNMMRSVARYAASGFEVPPVCPPRVRWAATREYSRQAVFGEPHELWHVRRSMEADSWEEPFDWSKASMRSARSCECERVPFEPSIEVQPTTRSAESPTGLEVVAVVPQTWENPYHDLDVESEGREGHAARRDDREPRLADRVWARAPPQQYACGNERLAAGRRLPAGIEDRVDRNRNAAARANRSPARSTSRHRMTTRSVNPNTPAGRCSRCMSSRRTRSAGS